jgi:hypothetical protein
LHEGNRQAEIMERQTTATEESVRLQETVQQQWVQVNGWRIEGRDANKGSTSRLTVVMDIGNPTAVPLTVETVTATVSGISFAFTARNLLAPDECCKADFPVVLSPEQIALYVSYQLVLMISGSVTYVDAFGKKKEQPFSQSCICGPDGLANFSPLQGSTRQ